MTWGVVGCGGVVRVGWAGAGGAGGGGLVVLCG